ncbi:adenylate/guanylate cyclase domain-containing protein [Pseudoalteromonas sp. SSM20]|uniref:adenylate/guanylate cyclase domain-containing protein n=1 Tax=Pseudoalteromonas sp. SSM20 TaxID=3139394 RepID=UPI003BAAB7A6
MAQAEQSKQTSAQELLAERKRLEEEFEARYTKRITVMFTDLVGSTSITETHGDIVTREMIKHHDDIIRERIEANQGKLVKTLGDGTMSYFPNTLCAIDAAVTIQNALAELNDLKKLAVPIKVRVGINYGDGIVEEDDIYGDVVNVAARIEAQANEDEIYISESAYQELSDKGKYYARVIKTTYLKGKAKPVQVIKVFYKEDEIDTDRKRTILSDVKDKLTLKGMFRIFVFFAVLIGLVFGYMQFTSLLEQEPNVSETRSKKTSMD